MSVSVQVGDNHTLDIGDGTFPPLAQYLLSIAEALDKARDVRCIREMPKHQYIVPDVYNAASHVCEGYETSRKIDGNGHHAACNIQESVTDWLLRRATEVGQTELLAVVAVAAVKECWGRGKARSWLGRRARELAAVVAIVERTADLLEQHEVFEPRPKHIPRHQYPHPTTPVVDTDPVPPGEVKNFFASLTRDEDPDRD